MTLASTPRGVHAEFLPKSIIIQLLQITNNYFLRKTSAPIVFLRNHDRQTNQPTNRQTKQLPYDPSCTSVCRPVGRWSIIIKWWYTSMLLLENLLHTYWQSFPKLSQKSTAGFSCENSAAHFVHSPPIIFSMRSFFCSMEHKIMLSLQSFCRLALSMRVILFCNITLFSHTWPGYIVQGHHTTIYIYIFLYYIYSLLSKRTHWMCFVVFV